MTLDEQIEVYKKKLVCARATCFKTFEKDPDACTFQRLRQDEVAETEFTTWDAFIAEVKQCLPLCPSCYEMAQHRSQRKRSALDPIE